MGLYSSQTSGFCFSLYLHQHTHHNNTHVRKCFSRRQTCDVLLQMKEGNSSIENFLL